MTADRPQRRIPALHSLHPTRMPGQGPRDGTETNRAMRIAIIGAGNVGGGLGQALAAAGHDVVFGVRDPESVKTQVALAEIPDAVAVRASEAVEGADVVVFALRPDALASMTRELPSLGGRVVFDAMNRFGGDPARSTAHDLADLLPGARIVKAFNTTGYENLTTAHTRSVPAAMFVAGDDPEAKAIAMRLAAEIGFAPEDAGGLANAKPLEEMVRVWLALATVHGRTVAFSVSMG
jgi:predicted dinucleotide-binding enzyme